MKSFLKDIKNKIIGVKNVNSKLPFKLPDLLNELIEKDIWPNNSNANSQNSTPIVDFERVLQIDPEAVTLFLYPLQFTTVSKLATGSESQLWSDLNMSKANSQIDSNKVVIIGDFGLGTDSAIALNYQYDLENPKVIRLGWVINGHKIHAEWFNVADSFNEFADKIGLSEILKFNSE